MNNVLGQFAAKPFAGQFLVITEYRDGNTGGTAPVVDLITVDQDVIDDPAALKKDESYVGVPASCDSALHDSLVEFELWPNGEVYLSGDGLDHARYRVAQMFEFEVATTLGSSDDLTTAEGYPVWWHVDQFDQYSWPDKEGVRVEMGIWHDFGMNRPGWEVRRAFSADPDSLVGTAIAEFEKPKYGSMPRAIRVQGKVVRSWFADLKLNEE